MPFSTLFLFGVCLLVSFLYAGIEAGLLSLDRTRLRSRVQQGDRAAVRLDRLLAHPGKLLATVLLVTNFADVAALVLITNVFARWFGGWGYAAAGGVMLPVYLLGLQLLPKSLFRHFPYRALAALAGLLEMTTRLLSPLLLVGSWLLRRRWVVPHAERDARRAPGGGLFIAREEFKELAAEGERTGAISPAEHGMIDNVIDFGNLPARTLMHPPPEVLRVREGMCVADLLDFARERRLDYLPLIAEGDRPGGRLAALVDVFTLLLERDPQRPAAAYMRRPPLIAAPDEPAGRVLRRLRAGRFNVAAVYDPVGTFVGIVRNADLVGRLVRQNAERGSGNAEVGTRKNPSPEKN